MTKKRKLVFEFGWVLVLIIFCGWLFFFYHRSPQYNILLITLDTVRPDFLGCYGNPQVKTPNIDTLAKQGVLFSTAVCEMPTTTPSHASILTSLYPRVHGILTNAWKLNDNITTLPEILKVNGYTTGGFVSVRHLEKKLGFAQGFDTFDDNFSGLHRNATQVTDVSLQWLNSVKKKKWFAWIHYFDAHSPYEPPEQFAQLYPAVNNGSQMYGSFSQISAFEEKKYIPTQKDIERMQALYAAEISYVDNELGRLFNSLDKMGLRKNTIIIVLADHGESFDHDIYAAHGQSLYDSSIRIPLIISAPQLLPKGKRIDSLVRTIDVMPTILDFLRIKSETLMQGKSLVPMIRNQQTPGEPYVVIERRHFESKKDCLRRHIPFGARYAVRSANWKYIWSETAPEELYHLQRDNLELINIAEQNQNIKTEYYNYLQKWLQENSRLRQWAYQKIDAETAEQLRSLGYIQ
ncbi:MAG: sulfatase-like hydrolase/transferase [bacterium]|nr:sulfatase-like hydrolase/transferase [bacterium]